MCRNSIRQKIERINEMVNAFHSEGQNWEKFQVFYNEIQHLKNLQLKCPNVYREPCGKQSLIKLAEWLNVNGVKLGVANTQNKKFALSFDFASISEGNGVFANRNIKKGELILKIPKRLMITAESIANHHVLHTILHDKLISRLDSMKMIVFLLAEKLDKNSFWTPYLDCIPLTNTTVYNWTLEQIQRMKDFEIFSHVVATLITAFKMYYILCHSEYTRQILPENYLTYENFTWALSTVYSRQNSIPLLANENLGSFKKNAFGDQKVQPLGRNVTLALIPGYEMFNYDYGEITSFYSLEEDSLHLMAMKDFNLGEQVYMCYGTRSNDELLLYQGFVHKNNPYDKFTFSSRIPSNDTLKEQKKKLLENLNFQQDALGNVILQLSNVLDPHTLSFFSIVCVNDAKLLTEDQVRMAAEMKGDLFLQSGDMIKRLLKLKINQLINSISKQMAFTTGNNGNQNEADRSAHEAITEFFSLQEKLLRKNLFLLDKHFT